jgi:CDP-paratose 2-epimerase
LLEKQMAWSGTHPQRICNLGGGQPNTMSLLQLSQWCRQRLGPHTVGADPHDRLFDIPWFVMDCRRAQSIWDWRPQTGVFDILEEIAGHAEQHENWLEVSGVS